MSAAVVDETSGLNKQSTRSRSISPVFKNFIQSPAVKAVLHTSISFVWLFQRPIHLVVTTDHDAPVWRLDSEDGLLDLIPSREIALHGFHSLKISTPPFAALTRCRRGPSISAR